MYNNEYESFIPRRGLATKKIDCVNIAIVYLLIYSTAYATLGSYNSTLSIILSLSSYVFVGLVINALPSIAISITKPAFFLIITFILIYVGSFIVAKDIEVHALALSGIVRFCIPAFLLGLSIRNADDLLKKLKIASWIILACEFFSIFILSSNQLVFYSYSQDTGYQALLPFIVLICEFYRNKRVADLFGTIFSTLLILMSGARGPLFCAIISFVIYCIFIIGKDNRKKIYLMVLFFFAALMVLLFYENILESLISLFQSIGASTRSIEGLLYSTISDDENRTRMKMIAWEYAKGHPFLGSGFINDRRIIHDTVSAKAATAYGTYCHNFFFEILMQFGLFPGSLIGLYCINKLIKSISTDVPIYARNLAIVLITMGFLPLMVSRSYLTHSYFYLLIGFLLAQTRTNEYYLRMLEDL